MKTAISAGLFPATRLTASRGFVSLADYSLDFIVNGSLSGAEPTFTVRAHNRTEKRFAHYATARAYLMDYGAPAEFLALAAVIALPFVVANSSRLQNQTA